MKWKNKKIISSILTVSIISTNFMPVIGYSYDEYEKIKNKASYTNNAINYEDLEYSEEYQEYLKLSDEEKSKYEVIPRKYDIPFDVLTNGKDTKPKKNLFNLFGLLGDSNNKTENNQNVPSKFDLRDYIDIEIEDQGNYGNCWNFASIKSLETNLALNGKGDLDLSELHLDYMMSQELLGDRELHDGGWFDTFEEYVTKHYGPVLEKEVPYREKYTEENYEYLLELEPKVYVEETINFPTIRKDNNKITEEQLSLFRTSVKNHIMGNGSLYCVIASPDNNTVYFNSYNKAEYCANKEQVTSARGYHAVSIIGWDDNYSRDNFNGDNKPEKDGAYICLNSWGEFFWGDNIFYVSYEDYEVESSISGVISANTEPTQNEVKFNDANLYKKLKGLLREIIDSYDDSKLTLYISKLGIQTVEELNLENLGIADISGIEAFVNLKDLNLSSNNIKNIEKLGELVNLKNINLKNNKITDFSPLANCINLNTVDLSSNNISDMKFIDQFKNFDKLFEIDLRDNAITKITNLSGFKNVSTIDLSGNNILSGFSEITNIYDIILDNCNIDEDDLEIFPYKIYGSISLRNNNLEDVSALNVYRTSLDLSDNPDLRTETIDINDSSSLTLNNCNITDVSFLSDYENLQFLELSHNPITDVTPIKNLKLYVLDISYTKVKDVSELVNLKQSLYMAGDVGITGYEKLSQLTDIDLSNCELSDISFVENYEKIYTLKLNNNNISDLSALTHFEELDEVYLSHNNITSFDVLKDIEDFYLLDLSYNQITEMSDIEFGDVYHLNLDGNKIKKVNKKISKNVDISTKNQRYEIDVKTRLNEENIFDMHEFTPEIYNNRIKSNLLEAENCSVDKKNANLTITPTKLGDDSSKIRVLAGMFEGSTYTINHTCEEELELIGIKVKQNSNRRNYLEGENFDKAGLIVEKIFEGGATKQIEDYTIVNGNNLTKDQTRVTIKYGEFETNIDINVFDEQSSVEVIFKDENLYKIISEKYLTNSKDIIINDISSLRMVLTKEFVDKFKEVSISKNGTSETEKNLRIEDLTGLSKFYNIENVWIYQENIKDLNEISKMNKLKGLSITSDLITDISPLTENNNLTNLTLICKNLENINPIKNMNNLESLTIDSEKLRDITSIGELEKIDYLRIESNMITDISAIGELENLVVLWLYTNNEIDLTPLNKLENIEHINLGNIKNEDLSCLEKNENICGISCYNGKVKEIGKLLENENLESMWIDSHFEENELEKNEESIILPEYIKTMLDANFEITVKTYYTIDENNNLKNSIITNDIISNEDEVVSVVLDKEINASKKAGKRAVEISARYCSEDEEIDLEGTCTIYYTTEGYNGLEKIYVETNPQKTEYKDGERFNPTGIVVKKVYTDGSEEVITDYVIINSDRELTTKDTQITISYEEDGITRKTTVDISVKEALKLEISDYQINEEYINKISPNTTCEQLLNNINTNAIIEILNKDSHEIQSDELITSGSVVKLTYKDEEHIYKLVVTGDMNGDGKVTAADLTALNKHIVGLKILEGSHEKAADTNFDGKITAADLTKLNKVIVGLVAL